jgi:hypothetical protein
MSKNMWIDAIDCKPVMTSHCNIYTENVLFWPINFLSPLWGYYNTVSQEWEQTSGKETFPATTVEYFAYIDNPYK